MNTSTTSIVGADAPPTPRAADRQIKARCSENLPDRRKNVVSGANSAPLLCPQSRVGALRPNYLFRCGNDAATPSFCGEAG